MPTEVQKNFRRQIREFQKQQKNRENEKFYSYIEKDFISHYYETRKRRRRRIISGVSIASLLLFLWNFYAISTWVNHIAYSITGKPLFSVESIFNRGAERHREVANYLKVVDPKEEQIQSLLNDAVTKFNEFLKNQKLHHEYIKEVNKHIQQVNKDILELKSINPPDVMKEFHEILLAEADLCYEILQTSLRVVNSTDGNVRNQYLRDVNALVSDFNNLVRTKRDKLLEVFDEIGMKYEVSGNRIRYWWRN
ncbi:MAG: hypothetical protein C0P72_008965 [Clostridia bacterium]|uniref:DUF5667 domain-containing protein n=1 Tax=Caldicoprobacter faecalis TaxID=937334 RepID=A0A1I5XJT5_9FIRM|nr:hypothetical protein [Caldicoprobacter faecalis]SFQ32241.1 hypothetical protein SAMN05444406_12728 [Caldicoprobacter faecalis]